MKIDWVLVQVTYWDGKLYYAVVALVERDNLLFSENYGYFPHLFACFTGHSRVGADVIGVILDVHPKLSTWT